MLLSDRSFKSYDDQDDDPSGPSARDQAFFHPSREPGLHFDRLTRSQRSNLSKAVDFFKLYFTLELVSNICLFTNNYALANIHNFVSYGDKEGFWSDPVTVEEMYKFIAVVIFMGFHELPSISDYWSSSWTCFTPVPRAFGTRIRFESILQFLKVVDHTKEDKKKEGKLTKIKYILEYIKDKCMSLFQPPCLLSIDERMVKSKGRSGMRQYIRDKPIKWGYKLWVLADAKTGYTSNFFVYTGKQEGTIQHGLGYKVVFDLLEDFKNQGYHIFIDNFYTSVQLLQDLHKLKTFVTGTMLINRKNSDSHFYESNVCLSNNMFILLFL